jgi:hypothetical protein
MKQAILAFAVAALVLVTSAAAAPAFNEQGMGKAAASGSNCLGIAQGCIQVNGTFRGKPISTGSFVAKFTVDWSSAKKTGTGATCATGGGSVDLSAKNGDTLSLNETGHVCKGGKSKYPYRFNGTFTITAGGGKYQSEGVGQGGASWQQLPTGRIRLLEVGSFSMKTRPPE